MKFFCDQMLSGMGRWLRAAGYDTLIADPGESDRSIWEKAQHDDRYLLTRDRHFIEIGHNSEKVVLLVSNALEDCVRELNGKFDINWVKNPFSRCLICNQELISASNADAQNAPEDVKKSGLPIYKCAVCNKIYWQGSHTDRMLKNLQDWQNFR